MFLLLLETLFLPASVTHYLLLCLEKECPKVPGLTLSPVVWTKPGFVPALQAHHSLAVQPLHCQSPSSLSPGPPVSSS